MVRDGYFYGLGLFAVAAVLYVLTGSHLLPVAPVLLAFFFLWFFRDPNRKIPAGPGLVVSPADGKVTEIAWIETPSGTRLKVSVFLNVFNVHVNRSPIRGVVRTVQYKRGLFMNAMRMESALMNEQNMIILDCGKFEIAVKQIAGLLARRIVCNVKEGDVLERGQRFGLIKFGSRVDILLPAEAKLTVKRGDHVAGGSSILAELPEALTAGAE